MEPIFNVEPVAVVHPVRPDDDSDNAGSAHAQRLAYAKDKRCRSKIHYTLVLPVLFLLRGQHFFQDATRFIVYKQGAFWKTVLPKCHGLQTGSILENSTPKMPWIANREHSGKQYS